MTNAPKTKREKGQKDGRGAARQGADTATGSERKSTMERSWKSSQFSMYTMATAPAREAEGVPGATGETRVECLQQQQEGGRRSSGSGDTRVQRGRKSRAARWEREARPGAPGAMRQSPPQCIDILFSPGALGRIPLSRVCVLNP